MAMPSLRQLRYFDALARRGHFGQAADECAVSQPALSMQIKQLEEELGLTLVERHPRGIALTEEGEAVAIRARAVLSAVQDLTDYARLRQDPTAGRVRIGVIPTIAPYLLPPALKTLNHRYPALELEVVEGQTNRLLAELDARLLDVLLLALPVTAPGVETMALFQDPFVLATSAADKTQALAGLAHLADLATERLLLLEDGHCLRDQALAFCGTHAADAGSAFSATSLATIVQLVANGFGVTLLPAMSLATEAAHAPLTIRRFAEPEPARTIGLAWRASSPQKAAFHAIGAVLQEVAGA